jgi:hypothetical protein
MSNKIGPIYKSGVARSTPFDNSTNGFTSTEVQSAIEEVKTAIQTSASPGFSFGRTGVCSGGTYLQCETVPSNISGRWVYINPAFIKRVFVSNELTTTYTIEITHHDGNQVNEVSLGTVTVTAAKGGDFAISWSVPTGKQLAAKISSSTANSPKNIVIGLELRGTS